MFFPGAQPHFFHGATPQQFHSEPSGQQPSSSKSPEFVIIIMAAGDGKRMNSPLPKVLHPFKGKPMLLRIVETVEKVSPKKVYVVTSPKNDELIQRSLKNFRNQSLLTFVQQQSPLGTGDAVKSCLSYIHSNDYVLILNGDMPCIGAETIVSFVNNCDEAGIITMDLENPRGYGRILKNEKKEFRGIREEKDCSEEERNIKEVNAGIYYFQSMILKTYIPKIKNENNQGEYYLTDIIEVINRHEDLEYYVHKINEDKKYEVMGVNTKEELERLENMF